MAYLPMDQEHIRTLPVRLCQVYPTPSHFPLIIPNSNLTQAHPMIQITLSLNNHIPAAHKGQ